jgi:hypothetical protein
MDRAAEHHMRHGCELALNRGADVGMIVAVARRPPGRDAVDELTPVGQHDTAAPAGRNRQRRRYRLHLRVRQPNVLKPGGVPIWVKCPYLLVFAGIGGHSALSW